MANDLNPDLIYHGVTISEENLSKITQLFNVFDVNGDRVLSFEDFAQVGQTDGATEFQVLVATLFQGRTGTADIDITLDMFQQAIKVLVVDPSKKINQQAYQQWWAEVRMHILSTPTLTVHKLMMAVDKYYNERVLAWITLLVGELAVSNRPQSGGQAYGGGYDGIEGVSGKDVKYSMVCSMSARVDDGILRAFHQLDTDASGEIDADDFKTAKARQLGFNRDACAFLMQHIDADGDGSISPAEWRLKFMKQVCTETVKGMAQLRAHLDTAFVNSGTSLALLLSNVQKSCDHAIEKLMGEISKTMTAKPGPGATKTPSVGGVVHHHGVDGDPPPFKANHPALFSFFILLQRETRYKMLSIYNKLCGSDRKGLSYVGLKRAFHTEPLAKSKEQELVAIYNIGVDEDVCAELVEDWPAGYGSVALGNGPTNWETVAQKGGYELFASCLLIKVLQDKIKDAETYTEDTMLGERLNTLNHHLNGDLQHVAKQLGDSGLPL